MNLTFEEFIPNNSVRIYLSMFLALAITWRSIPVIIKICNIKGLMENPIKRSSHASPTPTFGGVSIFAGTMIGFLLWNFGDEGYLMHKVLVGVVILFFLGIKDDLYALAPIKKLASQVIASSIVVIGSDLRIGNLFGIFGIQELPYLISVFFTIFIFVSLINSFNLIDGIDGLSGGIGMIVSGIFGLWFLLNEHWTLASLALSLCASLLAFLRYNFSINNKIFMGDTGSLIVGYIITVLAVRFIHLNVSYSFAPNSHFVSAPVIVLVLLSVPMFDTLRVFGLRIIRGKSPFSADRIHMHHLLVDNGFSHLTASLSFYFYTIGITILTYFARSFFTNTQLCFFVALLFGFYLVLGYKLEKSRLINYKKKLQEKDAISPKENGINIKEPRFSSN